MKKSEIEKIEIDIILEAIFKRYGYDFRHYAKASLKRRLFHFLKKSNLNTITQMTDKLLYDKVFFQLLLQDFSITVTEMFRDPEFYTVIVKELIPILKTYPFARIWHAGCATGEEVYSLAILLEEEGLLNRSRIIATDINDTAIEKAKEGIYSIDKLKLYIDNYKTANGKNSFSEYYQAQYDSVIMNKSLKKNIYFGNHNLVTDAVFCEANLILCRNVLIYFDKTLQNRVIKLLHNSLTYKGFLCLGNKETLDFTDFRNDYKVINKEYKIYQKQTRTL